VAAVRVDFQERGESLHFVLGPVYNCAYNDADELRMGSQQSQVQLKERCMKSKMKKEYNFSKGKRGAVVPAPKGKTRITIRIDDDILDWFRGEVEAAGGGNYQTLINQALREYLNQQQQPLEELLRRVVREELHSAAQ